LGDSGSRSEWRRLILYLSVCDLIHSMFYCVQWASPIVNDYVCDIISLTGIFSFSCASLWTAAIAHHLHKSVVRHTDDASHDGTRLFKERSDFLYYNIICWGYPWLIISTIVFVNYIYTKVLVRCKDGECFGCFLVQSNVPLRLLAIYIPLWGSWLYVVSKYIWIYRKSQGSQLKKKLILIPMIYIFSKVPETIFRVYEYTVASSTISDDDAFCLTLNILQAICNPLQGFLNFVFFYMNKMNVNQIKNCCTKPPTSPTNDASPPLEEEKKSDPRVSSKPSIFHETFNACFQCCKEFFLPLPPQVRWSAVTGLNHAADPLLGEPATSVVLSTDIVLQEGTQQVSSQGAKDDTQYEDDDERSGI